MSILAVELETPRWSAAPARDHTRTPPPKVTLAPSGFIEIRPHTDNGIVTGVAQVRRRLTAGRGQVGLLVTYLAVDANDKIITAGQAKYVHLFLTTVTTARPHRRTWTHLGRTAVPETIAHPRVNQMSQFGQAIEPRVQRRVRDLIRRWYPQVKFVRNTGRHHPGPDLGWTALAELYAEIGAELGDPFWRDLAREVAAAA